MSPDEAVALAERLAVLVPAGPVGLSWDHEAGRIAKRPLTRHGHLDWGTDPETIRRQFNAASLRPGEALGVGIWPGPAGWWVLDLDVGGDVDGRDTLLDLELEHGELPHHVIVATPSGGEHHYLTKSPGMHVGNAHSFGPGIDVRGDDGWVVAPGVTSPWGAWTVTQDGQMPDADTVPAWVSGRLSAGNGDSGRHEGARPLDRDALGEQDRAALEALERLGGHHPFSVGAAVHVTRRGKTAGNSATIGHIGPGQVYVFSSHWPPLRSEAVYDADQLTLIADAWEVGDKAKAERLAGPFGGIGSDEPAVGKAADSKKGRARYTTLRDVVPERVMWLWPGRLPFGKLVTLDGDPDVGKSTVTLDIAARLTTGRAMPHEDGPAVDPAPVLLMSAEDGLGDTIRPRLDAAGADSALVHHFDGIEAGDDALDFPNLVTDRAALETLVGDLKVRLVVVDVFVAFLDARVDSWKDQHVRRVLGPLAAVAGRTGACIWLLRHFTKDTRAAQALYRGGGSIGIVGGARSGLVAAKDPDDATGEGRVLAVAKHNLSGSVPSLSYRLVEDIPRGVAKVEWTGTSDLSADRLAVPGPRGKDHGADVELVAVVREAGEALTLTELVLRIGLSRPTIKVAAGRLVQRGFFIETTVRRERADGKLGQPTIAYAINPEGPAGDAD